MTPSKAACTRALLVSLFTAGAAHASFAMAPVCATVFAAIAADARPAAEDLTSARAEDESYVVQDEKFFAPVLAEARAALESVADTAGMTHRVLEGGAPHLLLFVEGSAADAVHGHPVVQVLRALAGNHQLGMEYQATRLDDGALLFGFILFSPFPTLELSWVSHPQENVATRGGAWVQPFADLSDVERIDVANGRATLHLRAEAARRVDRLSNAHGHRIYRLRGAGMADAADLGTYTWLAGLRTIPGVPTEFTCRQPRRDGQWKEGVSLSFLHQRYAEHAEARQHVCRELGLAEEVSWTVAEGTPHFREPVYAWVVHAPEDGGVAAQAPWAWNEVSGAPRPWLELAPVASGLVSAPVPAHWAFFGGGPARLESRESAGSTRESAEVPLNELIRQNAGRELAILVRGEVVARAVASGAGSRTLVLRDLAPEAGNKIQHARRAVPKDVHAGVAGEKATPAEPTREQPAGEDRFQVRLMAEPQHREIIPVTHYRAPGSAPDVVVAVQNDIILDGRSVTGAALETKQDALYLKLSLTPEAQDALDGACFSNMGKQLAIVYDGRLLSAPTISDWDHVELAFKGLDDDWPDVARVLADYLSEAESGE